MVPLLDIQALYKSILNSVAIVTCADMQHAGLGDKLCLVPQCP